MILGYMPNTVPGLLAALVLLVVGVVALFTTGILQVVVVAVVLALAAYLLYALATRLHKRLTEPSGGGA